MMKTIIRLAACTFGISCLTFSALGETLEGWTPDLNTALEQAKKEKKMVLVDFTGSDWCSYCIQMKKNVFSKPEFIKKASTKYVLVELDFPRGNPELANKNKPLASKYEITGFPTIILMDAEGKVTERFTATQYPDTDTFLKHIGADL